LTPAAGSAALAAPSGEPAPSRRHGWGGRGPRGLRFRLSPAWGLALLVVGFLAGRVVPGGGSLLPGRGQPTPSDDGATIANVDFHDSDPGSGRVRLTFD